jgi:hypothetical protein
MVHNLVVSMELALAVWMEQLKVGKSELMKVETKVGYWVVLMVALMGMQMVD